MGGERQRHAGGAAAELQAHTGADHRWRASSTRGTSQGMLVAGVVSYAEVYGRSVALGGGIMKVQAEIAVTPTTSSDGEGTCAAPCRRDARRHPGPPAMDHALCGRQSARERDARDCGTGNRAESGRQSGPAVNPTVGHSGRIGGFPSYADLVAANHAIRAPRFVSMDTVRQVASGSTTSPL